MTDERETYCMALFDLARMTDSRDDRWVTLVAILGSLIKHLDLMDSEVKGPSEEMVERLALMLAAEQEHKQ